MENRELSIAEWLSKAQAYCARAEHCAADVRRKLYEWGTPQEIEGFSREDGLDLFDFIEQKLYEDGYLNDARYCEAYVHDKVAYQKWGRLKIQAGLRALQLPEDAICAAIDGIDEAQYAANLRALANQRRTDPPDKRLRFLSQRGFTYSEIKSYLS